MPNHRKVISFPSVGHWRFFDVVEGVANPIQRWYQNELSDTGRFLFDGLLKDNAKIALPIHWIGFKRFLHGKYRKERIWEWQFFADGRQYRVLGIFGDVRQETILLIGCYHKGAVYTPPDALDIAYRRARAFRERRAGSRWLLSARSHLDGASGAYLFTMVSLTRDLLR